MTRKLPTATQSLARLSVIGRFVKVSALLYRLSGIRKANCASQKKLGFEIQKQWRKLTAMVPGKNSR